VVVACKFAKPPRDPETGAAVYVPGKPRRFEISNVKGLGGTLFLAAQFAEKKQVQHWQDVIEKLEMKYGWKQESRSTADITLTVDSIMYDRCQVRFSLPLEKEKRFDDFYHDKHVIALDSDRRKLQEFEVLSESKKFTPVIPRVLWELNRDPHCLCTTHEQVVEKLRSSDQKIGTFFSAPFVHKKRALRLHEIPKPWRRKSGHGGARRASVHDCDVRDAGGARARPESYDTAALRGHSPLPRQDA